jgi:hypothetical protein
VKKLRSNFIFVNEYSLTAGCRFSGDQYRYKLQAGWKRTTKDLVPIVNLSQLQYLSIPKHTYRTDKGYTKDIQNTDSYR